MCETTLNISELPDVLQDLVCMFTWNMAEKGYREVTRHIFGDSWVEFTILVPPVTNLELALPLLPEQSAQRIFTNRLLRWSVSRFV